ncbi:expressed unknown protein [Seminavis robusta]|uniref:Uncharacterized protein n=1 Tax=Seminavis robusta TaxID=568900 RepID=A0A9N8DHC1_9STRA|nr:expressed unknown protein [Seminavis robusta]|eukprot:Sro127_g060930.1 n/a (1018) ;mRNA; r:83890-86943
MGDPNQGLLSGEDNAPPLFESLREGAFDDFDWNTTTRPSTGGTQTKFALHDPFAVPVLDLHNNTNLSPVSRSSFALNLEGFDKMMIQSPKLLKSPLFGRGTLRRSSSATSFDDLKRDSMMSMGDPFANLDSMPFDLPGFKRAQTAGFPSATKQKDALQFDPFQQAQQQQSKDDSHFFRRTKTDSDVFINKPQQPRNANTNTKKLPQLPKNSGRKQPAEIIPPPPPSRGRNTPGDVPPSRNNHVPSDVPPTTRGKNMRTSKSPKRAISRSKSQDAQSRKQGGSSNHLTTNKPRSRSPKRTQSSSYSGPHPNLKEEGRRTTTQSSSSYSGPHPNLKEGRGHASSSKSGGLVLPMQDDSAGGRSRDSGGSSSRMKDDSAGGRSRDTTTSGGTTNSAGSRGKSKDDRGRSRDTTPTRSNKYGSMSNSVTLGESLSGIARNKDNKSSSKSPTRTRRAGDKESRHNKSSKHHSGSSSSARDRLNKSSGSILSASTTSSANSRLNKSSGSFETDTELSKSSSHLDYLQGKPGLKADRPVSRGIANILARDDNILSEVSNASSGKNSGSKKHDSKSMDDESGRSSSSKRHDGKPMEDESGRSNTSKRSQQSQSPSRSTSSKQSRGKDRDRSRSNSRSRKNKAAAAAGSSSLLQQSRTSYYDEIDQVMDWDRPSAHNRSQSESKQQSKGGERDRSRSNSRSRKNKAAAAAGSSSLLQQSRTSYYDEIDQVMDWDRPSAHNRSQPESKQQSKGGERDRSRPDTQANKRTSREDRKKLQPLLSDNNHRSGTGGTNESVSTGGSSADSSGLKNSGRNGARIRRTKSADVDPRYSQHHMRESGRGRAPRNDKSPTRGRLRRTESADRPRGESLTPNRGRQSPKNRRSGSVEAPKDRRSGSLEAPRNRRTGSVEAKKIRRTGSVEAPRGRRAGSVEARGRRTGSVEAKRISNNTPAEEKEEEEAPREPVFLPSISGMTGGEVPTWKMQSNKSKAQPVDKDGVVKAQAKDANKARRLTQAAWGVKISMAKGR